MRRIRRVLRGFWSWLTSMRTALLLLFLLALAAVPGALLPQRGTSDSEVEQYLEANGTVGRIYDQLYLFNVFGSPWFTAIYVLLMVSLVACIIPRTIDHYRAMRTPPPRAPRRLERMPHHREGVVPAAEDEVAGDIGRLLRGWHVTEVPAAEDRAGARSFSAERGYAREFFNLVFHLGLVVMLVFIAYGRLTFYEGQVIVVTESGSPGVSQREELEQSTEFCNTATANFDDFRAGRLFDGTGLTPFCFVAHDFSAHYLPNGQADMFTSSISYAVGDEILTDPDTWTDYELKVNEPLRIAGDSVHLQGHGYAPTFTVRWPNGETRTQTVQFRPDDPTFFLSSGVVRFDPPAGMYPALPDRRQHQLAIQGLFAPTASWGGEKGELLQSAFPALNDPAVAVDIYRGDNGLDTGRGQSLFSLDPTLIQSGQLQKVDRVNLTAGDSVTLDDGTEVTFEGAHEFANYQISRDPSKLPLLISSIVMLSALMLSLSVKRRRIWVRLRPADGAATRVELAGLARTDSAGWGPEFDSFARKILRLPEEEDAEGDEG